MVEVITAEALLQRVADDREHGATELALLAIDGVAELAENQQETDAGRLRQSLLTLVEQLRTCRPSMVPLENLLHRLSEALSGLPVESSSAIRKLRGGIKASCATVGNFARQEQNSAVRKLLKLVKPGDLIMTHSISSSVKRIGEQLVQNGIEARFIVTESRPGDEGRLLAAFLSELGVATTFITEAQIDLFMPRVDKVVIGADSVLADGSVINKCGSNLLALSARYHQVPFYVCAESFKRKRDVEFILEEMAAEELDLELPGVTVRNIYFERLPAELITRLVG